MINHQILIKEINNPILRKRTYSGVSASLNKANKDAIPLRKAGSNHNTEIMRKQTPSKELQNRTKTESLRTFTYNKWYIKPANRLKKSVRYMQADKTREQFYYKDLFRPNYADPQCPFNQITNEKVKLLENIPKNNLSYLELFRKEQMGRKKRVPQIIEMLLKRKENYKLKLNATQ